MVAPKGPGRQRAAGTIDGLSSGWHTPSSSESEWSNVASEAVWPSAFLPRASKQAGRHHRTRREWRPTKLPLSSGQILLALYHSSLTVPKHPFSHFIFMYIHEDVSKSLTPTTGVLHSSCHARSSRSLREHYVGQGCTQSVFGVCSSRVYTIRFRGI